MAGEVIEREISFNTALIIIGTTLIIVIVAGILVGEKYFWNQYNSTTRLEKELNTQKKALAKKPKDAEVILQLGWIYYQQGKKEKALKYYQQVLKTNPNHLAGLFNSGLVYFDQGKYTLAQQKFQKVRSLYPKYLENLLALGQLYVKINKPDYAIETLKELIKIKSSWTQPHFYLGQAYALKGMNKEADAAFREALRFDPKFEAAKQALAKLGGEKGGDKTYKTN